MSSANGTWPGDGHGRPPVVEGPIARRVDWRRRLNALLEDRRHAPATATNNCGFFAADAIEAMTGVDLAMPFRGQSYETLAEAVAALQSQGFVDICAFAAAHLKECHPSRARTGDLMAFPSEQTGWALGIVNGERVTVMTERGLGTVSRMEGQRAFRVG